MGKKNEKVVLEDVELKPQVVGHIYEKKTNIGRVLVIFAIFGLVVFYINDITLYLNNLFGKKSSTSIKELTEENKKKKEQTIKENEGYYDITEDQIIIVENLSITHFKNENNIFSFDVYNYTDNDINLASKKYYLELYNSDKKILEDHIIDFNTITSKNKKTFNIEVGKEFKYIKIISKDVSDYSEHNITYNNEKIGTLICTKNNSVITYIFKDNKLQEIEDIYTDIKDLNNYYIRYNNSLNKVNEYNNIDGIDASFNPIDNGYKVIYKIDLSKVNIDELNNNYYYKSGEIVKVVNYEMNSRGYNCK